MRMCINLQNKIFNNKITYSQILQNCRTNKAVQKLFYQGTQRNEQFWGFPVNYSNSFNVMLFDPWSGKLIKESCYDSLERIGEKELIEQFENDRKLHSKERYCTSLESSTRYGERCDTSLIEIPNIRVLAVLNKVEFGGWKDEQFELFRERNGYQGIEEWEFKGWTSLDYCPFCGAKLPERFDKKIIEVLKEEYGLESWKDYKKAPHEFHTDEWWRKRGL